MVLTEIKLLSAKDQVSAFGGKRYVRGAAQSEMGRGGAWQGREN